MSIDVVGYSRMMQSDPSRVLAALNAIFLEVVRPAVNQCGGRVVKLMGDGAIVEFASASLSIDCAVVIQRHMRSWQSADGFREPILLRIGIHAGDVLAEGNDLFGDCVNVAARLQAQAQPGGVLVSRDLVRLASGNVRHRLRGEGIRSLKNIKEPVEVLSIDIDVAEGAIERQDQLRSIEARFCRSSDGQMLAWTSIGNGPPLVKAPNWIGHLELDWRSPWMGQLLRSLAAERRVVYFDARGNGISDWELKNITFELLVDDLAAVFNAAGVERAPLIAISQGCAIAAAFAARNPGRVSGIVMIGGFPVGRAKRGSPIGRERAKALQAMMAAGWDDEFPSLRDLIAEQIVPGASLEDRRRYAEDMRSMISPGNLARYRQVIDNIDVTDLLPSVEAPCLIIHTRGDRMHPLEQGRKMAAGIPNARFIAYDSLNHAIPENDPCWPLVEREIHFFLHRIKS